MKHKEINLSSASLDSQAQQPEVISTHLYENIQTDLQAQTQVITEKKENIFKKAVDSFKSKPLTTKLLFIFVPIVIVVIALVGLYFFDVLFGKKSTPPQMITVSEPYLLAQALPVDTSEVSYLLNEPSIPRTEVSPINGKLFTKAEMDKLNTRRPVAVMTNNHAAARPTSGLSKADLVFETIAESGITRFMAIYWSQGPTKVGPIRSARQYFLEWLSPFDPLFIYDGFASSTNPKLNAGGNMYDYGLKLIYTYGAWRVNDGTRVAPHNEYSSVVTAWEYAKNQGWDGAPKIESWQFKRDTSLDERGDKTKVKIYFFTPIPNGGLYDVIWEYNKDTNSYLRYSAGVKDIDLETGTQISAKNVVIQRVNTKAPADTYGRAIIDTIGDGTATILQDGKIIEGKWKKTSRTSRTRFYDKSGKEIQFNRGLTWIAAVPLDQGKFDIIEK